MGDLGDRHTLPRAEFDDRAVALGELTNRTVERRLEVARLRLRVRWRDGLAHTGDTIGIGPRDALTPPVLDPLMFEPVKGPIPHGAIEIGADRVVNDPSFAMFPDPEENLLDDLLGGLGGAYVALGELAESVVVLVKERGKDAAVTAADSSDLGSTVVERMRLRHEDKLRIRRVAQISKRRRGGHNFTNRSESRILDSRQQPGPSGIA